MPLSIEQLIYKIKSKKLFVFAGLLFIISKQIVTGNDVWCPLETMCWGPEEIPITWPETIASNRQIASDCMYDKKQLLTRTCESRISGWDPNSEDTLSRCVFYQPSYEKYGNCPPGYIESDVGDICYQQIISQPWDELCLTTSGSSLSFLDLKSNEQYSILQQLSATTGVSALNVGLPAKNQWPSKQISSEIDYGTEDIELQWLLLGRYASILKLRNDSATVTCSFRNLCIEMCLSMNVTGSTPRKPFALAVDECSNINSVLCVSRKNSFLECTESGYYRVGYNTTNTLSYSIKIFDQPLDIHDESETILQLFCEGNKIFRIDTLESHIIYRQLAAANKLGKWERCLFGILSLDRIIRYSDWFLMDAMDINAIQFTNWNKSMDFNSVTHDSYLTVNSDGLWSWEGSATCIVCALDNPPSQIELKLEFNNSDSKLTLTVTGQEYLWRENNSEIGFLCFALISNIYTDVPVQSTCQNKIFSLVNLGAGIYWCSGHLIQPIQLVSSKIVYAFGMVFAFHVEYHCHEECAEPFNDTAFFEKLLTSLVNAKDLMKIEGVQYVDHDGSYTDREVKMLMFHVMVSVNEEISQGNESNEIGLSEDQLATYYALKELRQLQFDSSPFGILSITSREFCLPDSITHPKLLNWKAAKVGETVWLSEMCFNFTRTCLSNGSNGAVWNDYAIRSVCNNHTHISRSLIELHNNFQLPEETSEVIVDLSTTLHNVTLNEADVFIASEILEKVSNFFLTDQVTLSLTDLENIFDTFNSLMLISQGVSMASSQLNSTNSLLASCDEILLHQAQTTDFTNHDSSLSDVGVLSFRFPLVANYIIDPIVSGFSGFALRRNGTDATDFGDFQSHSLKFLQPNQCIESVLRDENVILAAFVPQKLIESWTNPKIIFTLFLTDILFQPYNRERSADGSIVSLTISNFDSKLTSSIPFIFKPNTSLARHSNYMAAQFCGYWSLSGSEWDTTGCQLNELSLQISDKILCECSHLTHFGNLVNTEIIFSEIDENALNLITLAGCVLSLVGIIGIFLTAIIFRSWRSKSSSKFLLQLSAAIALQMILLIFINSNDNVLVTISENLYGCIATGALIHYSILVMFFWMLIVAYLQFIRYVIVFNQIATANFLLKSSIFGWGMPMLPVFIVVAVNPTSYIPSTSNVKFCYPSGYGLLFGLLVPIILIVLANMFVFVAVVISLIKGSSKSAACKVNDKNEAMWSQLRLSVFLFFILGLSWIFAFLSDYSILFSYLFCLTATMQGLVLFFYFVILDPVARNLWKRLFIKICCCKWHRKI